ncbi:MAG: LysR family transcriptional regulator [Verrucomicrobia bacterium]|nr:LysR family transcriptional regulator [Verrucomicrobiota bacterium]
MEWLNYHHLRYFWMVAKEGTLKQASLKMAVSQPSISAQIRLLENLLGENLFRRSGRRLIMTDIGQMVFGYAEEIFSAGQEMLAALKQTPGNRPLRFRVGITDSVPKLVASHILRPAFEFPRPVHVVCREGGLDFLLVELASYRLDIVLADESASRGLQVRTFSHLLGKCGTTLCAAREQAARLRRGFPRSLDGAAALLPSEMTSLRISLGRWFDSAGIRPKVIAEFEDSALMKSVAAEGLGFTAIPSVIVKGVQARYGLETIATIKECQNQFYAITAERRLKHPVVLAITERSRSDMFAGK